MLGRSGVRVVYNKLPMLHKEALNLVDQAIRKATLDIEAQAKTRVPVDTGALKNSIRSSFPGQYQGKVTVGQEYGMYVEYGTYRMAAQPFMRPAIDAVAPSLKHALDRLATYG